MRALVVALSIVTVPAAALADAISHPPDDCAEGSEGIRCHGSPTCRPVACTTDAECGEGKACEERSLCIDRHCCGGRSCYTTTGQNEAAFSDHVTATCANGAACASGSCESRRVCVPAEEPDEPAMNEPAMNEPAMNEPTSMETSTQTHSEETEDESCSASSTAGGGLVLTALVALAIASRRRRRY
jgi:MYXO-CTERM domain-containing protein